MQGEEAEKVWNRAALKGYREYIADADERCENVPSWPEDFPYQAEWPQGLLTKLAGLAGAIAGQDTKAWYEYNRKLENSAHP